MQPNNLSRRGFLARSVGGLVAAGLPVWYAEEIVAQAQNEKTPRRRGPNDRIVMAAIGTGTNRTRRRSNQQLHGERGVAIMRDAMAQPNVQYVAVCDVDRPNAEFAQHLVQTAERGGSRECRVYTDYREVLQNRDIDAVTIGTPDHWHAAIAIAAMKAGKDVYCEKPLTLTIDEGKAMVRAVRETNKVLQTGSQQRSDARFRLACELVRNGRVGTVRQITTLIGTNPTGGPFPVKDPPAGLNWDFWLGQTARAPYCDERCFYDFRRWSDYSGGKKTDRAAHHNDIAQWALGMDNSGPITVTGRGAAPSNQPNSFNCHPTFEVTYTYGNGPNGAPGTRLVCRSDPPANLVARNGNRPQDNGILFEGDDGKWIFVNRSTIIASDGDARTSRLITEPLPQGATRLEVSRNHMGNFMQCLGTRRPPICNVNVGHRSVTVCHLGVIATRFFPGQTLHWNPQEERFTGDQAETANRHLSRPRREGYPLEA
jgi:predicted dehydrogenase